jgi:hypothetical protein
MPMMPIPTPEKTKLLGLSKISTGSPLVANFKRGLILVEEDPKARRLTA